MLSVLAVSKVEGKKSHKYRKNAEAAATTISPFPCFRFGYGDPSCLAFIAVKLHWLRVVYLISCNHHLTFLVGSHQSPLEGLGNEDPAKFVGRVDLLVITYIDIEKRIINQSQRLKTSRLSFR